MKRRICIITGSRAEYGLLHPLITKINDDQSLELQIIACGMHLSPEFGLTFRQIEEDGFKIDEKVEMLLSSDSSVGVSKSVGLGIISFSECFNRLKPDLVVGLGDRYELLSAVISATVARIPIAHIHGGESTEGAIDESFRHSITKMSHLHFTSTEIYRKRVIQLGEEPGRVFNVGAIGIDNIKNLKLLSKEELEKKIAIKFPPKNILVTFHPVTLENRTSADHFQEVLDALDELKDLHIIFTFPNADTDGRIIIKMINDYVKNNSSRATSFTSLGQIRYLSLLQYVDAMVGNSSSGIIEMPSFQKGTINIGDRQRGRVQAESVINCFPQKESILGAFKKLYSRKFQKILKNVKNPYGDGGTSEKILKIINSIDLNNLIKKKFYNISFNL